MDIIEFRELCLSLPFVKECTPFNEDTLVFKVGGKMFAFTDMAGFSLICLKCRPETVAELCEKYSYVGPGYYMSKRHWITIKMDHDPPDDFVRQRVRESYRLVIENMPCKIQKELTDAISGTGYRF